MGEVLVAVALCVVVVWRLSFVVVVVWRLSFVVYYMCDCRYGGIRFTGLTVGFVIFCGGLDRILHRSQRHAQRLLLDLVARHEPLAHLSSQ